MEATVLRRRPVAVPSFEGFPCDLRVELVAVSAALETLAPLAPLRVKEAPDSLFAPLRHRLSGPYVALHGHSETPIRSEAERKGLGWLESRHPALGCGDPAAFPEALEALDLMLAGERGGWRTGTIRTVKDARGNSIRFPPLSSVRRQLERLRRLLDRSSGEAPPLFVATMAIVLLTNCHPFKDANGRIGRILFNHVLRRGGMARSVYVPLFELAARSEGGYLIALRQGELRGDWEPLLEFMIAMLGVHRALSSWHAAVSDVA